MGANYALIDTANYDPKLKVRSHRRCILSTSYSQLGWSHHFFNTAHVLSIVYKLYSEAFVKKASS